MGQCPYRDGASGMRFLAFLTLLLISSVSIADNVIVGAFGQKLGAVVDSSLVKSTWSRGDEALYEFKPEKPYYAFQIYAVAITPVTKRIYEIMAWGYIF